MKTYDIKWSPLSIEDLDRIWDEVWTASEDLDTTEKYVEGLREKVREKCKAPKTGSPVNYMGEFTGVYRVQFKEYFAFYRIRGEQIEVSRILYARSDYMRNLFGKSEFVPEDTAD